MDSFWDGEVGRLRYLRPAVTEGWEADADETDEADETDAADDESADDGEGGVVTFTHAGGDALDANRVDVVVEPATDGLRPWDDDADEVTEGDETSVSVDTEPEMAIVVFNESEVLHREPINQDG